MFKRCILLFVVFLFVNSIFVFGAGGYHSASEILAGTFGSKTVYNVGEDSDSLKLTMYDSGSKVTVSGINKQSTGTGVYGKSTGSSGVGVFGDASSGFGVEGSSVSGIGVAGVSGSGYGVYGATTSGYSGYFNGGRFLFNQTNVSIVGGGIDKDNNPLLTLRDMGEPALSIVSASSDDKLNPLFSTHRSRGSVNSPLAIQAGDTLLELWGEGYNGASFEAAGQITIRSDGGVSGSSVPGYISFATSPAGSVVPVRRMIIRSDGKVGIGTESPGQLLDVDGYVKGTGLCIGADCRTAWPVGNSGDITGVSASTGLSGGGSSGDVSLSVDYAATQKRVSSSCGAGSSIRVINQDGTVTCQTDNSGPKILRGQVTVPGGDWIADRGSAYVTFSSGFSTVPTVTATPIGYCGSGATPVVSVGDISTTGFTIYLSSNDYGRNGCERPVNWIAIGT